MGGEFFMEEEKYAILVVAAALQPRPFQATDEKNRQADNQMDINTA